LRKQRGADRDSALAGAQARFLDGDVQQGLVRMGHVNALIREL
jgi:hypothetical protein